MQIRSRDIGPSVSRYAMAQYGGEVYFLNASNGSDLFDGKSWERPFATLSKAIATVEPWSTLFIAAGVYIESVSRLSGIDSLTLIGESPFNSVLTSPTTDPALHLSAANLRIEHVGFTAGVDGSVGLQLTSCDHAEVARCFFYSIASGVTGLLLETSDVVDLHHNSLTPYGGPGTFAFGFQTVSQPPPPPNVVLDIHHNWLRSADVGLSIESGYSFVRVRENIVQECTTGLSLPLVSYCTVVHNDFLANTTQVSHDVGTDVQFVENHYDDYTTDTNNDGICDAAYAIAGLAGASDRYPLSHHHGFFQSTLGFGL